MYIFFLIFDFLNNLSHNVNKIVLVLNTIFFQILIRLYACLFYTMGI